MTRPSGETSLDNDLQTTDAPAAQAHHDEVRVELVRCVRSPS